MGLLRALSLSGWRGRLSLWSRKIVPALLTFVRQLPMIRCTLISVHRPGKGHSHAPRAAGSEAFSRRNGSQDSDRRDRRESGTEVGPRSQWASGGEGARQEPFGRGPQQDSQKGGGGAVARMTFQPQALKPFKPDRERILEAIIYLINKGKNLSQYDIVKTIFLADKAHLNRYGRPI